MSFNTTQDKQLLVISILIMIITVVIFIYMFAKTPESLKASSHGVPFFTPDAIHPESGEIISIEKLVKHFKGN
mgnify:FL=1|jgi:hypothetical protein